MVGRNRMAVGERAFFAHTLPRAFLGDGADCIWTIPDSKEWALLHFKASAESRHRMTEHAWLMANVVSLPLPAVERGLPWLWWGGGVDRKGSKKTTDGRRPAQPSERQRY